MSDYSEDHKVPTFKIHRLTNQSAEFYPLVGPLLARREIVAELGGPVWDDNDKVWCLAVEDDIKQVLAMIAIQGDTACSFYVIPGSRGQAIGYAMLNAAVNTGATRATATDASLPLFLMFGFKETGTRGRFHLMVRP